MQEYVLGQPQDAELPYEPVVEAVEISKEGVVLEKAPTVVNKKKGSN